MRNMARLADNAAKLLSLNYSIFEILPECDIFEMVCKGILDNEDASTHYGRHDWYESSSCAKGECISCGRGRIA